MNKLLLVKKKFQVVVTDRFYCIFILCAVALSDGNPKKGICRQMCPNVISNRIQYRVNQNAVFIHLKCHLQNIGHFVQI